MFLMNVTDLCSSGLILACSIGSILVILISLAVAQYQYYHNTSNEFCIRSSGNCDYLLNCCGIMLTPLKQEIKRKEKAEITY